MHTVFDSRACHLGEGALWHPQRRMLFWFDILGQRLLGRGEGGAYEAQLGEIHSAAAWIDRDHLLLASETGLWRFHIDSRCSVRLAQIEADERATRSNDGRADPWGGFWISTMGKGAEPGAGAIYRYRQGKLARLRAGLTIPNSICFAPDRGHAYFSDTVRRMLWRWSLDGDGWPAGEPVLWKDFAQEGLNPDGAVTDAAGAVWVAHWGAACVNRYGPDGRCLESRRLPVPQPSCPALGEGRLFVTTAQQGLAQDALAAYPLSGQTFDLGAVAHGRQEPAFIP
ncbi:SMP-30/gluconolactonase/LRE family protein [Orrella sp. JC864]|uniref:SMP-30/gluconolactonase/LRE family protein n=1 Tax=Orrella sp. JC864 TaxID=3120298 RepID=UPI00300BB16C